MKVYLTRSQIISIICDIEVGYLQDGYNGDKKEFLKRQRIVDKLTKVLNK
tara:strand:+ start:282 stop:431 length:150 start_codon:yes stop_codon:yes gene_type:complete